MALGSVGVVYGDIGTSPLYALKASLEHTKETGAHQAEIVGIVSLLIWALIFIVTVKYVILIMRADNHGEGGTLSLVALRHMSAFSAQMAINLEPVYAIVLAMLLLAEQRELTPMFYLGVAIILAAVFAHPLLRPHRRIDHPEVLGTSEAKGIVD